MAKKTRTGKLPKKLSPIEKVMAAVSDSKAKKEQRAAEAEVQKALEDGPQAKAVLAARTQDKKLDSTLARLEKAGKIQTVGGRWVLTSLKVCPQCGGKGWVKS